LFQFLLNRIADNSTFLGKCGALWEVFSTLEWLLSEIKIFAERYQHDKMSHFYHDVQLGWEKLDEYSQMIHLHMSLPFVFTLDTSGNGLRRNGRTGRIGLRLLNWVWTICRRSIK
jgi:hypothetical protein